jgi:hypothetical protein
MESDLRADLPTLPLENAPQGKRSSRLGGQVALDFVFPLPLKGVGKYAATCGAGVITLHGAGLFLGFDTPIPQA